MHPNPVYRSSDTEQALAFAAERGFGILTLQGPAGPLASHVPFVLSNNCVSAHLVRSNPIVPVLKESPQDALFIVSGPDGYISPDWYGTEGQVPTWNYVAVHVRGKAVLGDPSEMPAHVDHLSEVCEERLLPKKPWTMEKIEPEAGRRLMRMLLPLTIEISNVESTWKLNQNKTDDQRAGAARGVEHAKIGMNPHHLAKLMRDSGAEQE